MSLLVTLAAVCAAGTVPELVNVGNPGNAGKAIPFRFLTRAYPRGTVAYPYRIGKQEVSNAEYADFLNAAAKTDQHGLFNDKMKITRKGSAGNWRYTPVSGSEKEPVTFVSRIAAARYCNYLTTGDTERGAYVIALKVRENGKKHEVLVGFRDLSSPDSPVIYYLPDMHEFFKARHDTSF